MHSSTTTRRIQHTMNQISPQPQSPKGPIKLVLIGPPSSSKGTFAQLISKAYNIPAISTGELIRAEVKSGSAIGLQVKELIATGAFVKDDVVIDLLAKRLQQDDAQNGFILDGFPRTLPQAEQLAKTIPITLALQFILPFPVIIEAVKGRRSCGTCQQGYNLADINYQDMIIMKPLVPKVENTCDQCGTSPIQLEQREDDKEDVIKNRLQVYEELTAPILSFYEIDGKLISHSIKNGKKDWPLVQALLEANLNQ